MESETPRREPQRPDLVLVVAPATHPASTRWTRAASFGVESAVVQPQRLCRQRRLIDGARLLDTLQSHND